MKGVISGTQLIPLPVVDAVADAVLVGDGVIITSFTVTFVTVYPEIVFKAFIMFSSVAFVDCCVLMSKSTTTLPVVRLVTLTLTKPEKELNVVFTALVKFLIKALDSFELRSL